MTLTSKTFVWWDNVSERTTLPELIRLINKRRVKLDLGEGDELEIGTGPADLPNCLLWWRAHDLLLTKVDSDEVAFIPDATGNAKHGTQATAGRFPLFKTNILNGYPVLEFPTNNDYLTSPDCVQPTTGTTVYLVTRILTNVAYGGIQSFAQTGATDGDEGAALKDENTTHFWWGVNSTTASDKELTTSTITDWNVVTLNFLDTSNLSIYFNNALDSTFNPNTTIEGSNLCRMVIGAVNGSGVYYGANCQIAEVVWFGDPHNAIQMGQVTDFLTNKYAL